MIEVEKIAVFSETTYKDLRATLQDVAEDLGQNNTSNIFYIGDTYQVKVATLHDQNRAKIALKSGDLADHSSEEYEVHFTAEEAPHAEKILDTLLKGIQKFPTTQQRHDYRLDGVEIALKFSDDWGYHAELEVMAKDQDAVAAALEKIEAVAKKLGLETLSKEEMKARIASILGSKP